MAVQASSRLLAVGVLMAVLIGTSLPRTTAPWLLGPAALDGKAWLLWAQPLFDDLLLRREGLRSASI